MFFQLLNLGRQWDFTRTLRGWNYCQWSFGGESSSFWTTWIIDHSNYSWTMFLKESTGHHSQWFESFLLPGKRSNTSLFLDILDLDAARRRLLSGNLTSIISRSEISVVTNSNRVIAIPLLAHTSTVFSWKSSLRTIVCSWLRKEKCSMRPISTKTGSRKV